MTTADQPQGTTGNAGSPQRLPRRWGWRGLALIVSLALNLFLFGLLAGGRLADWRDPDPVVGGAFGPGAVSRLMRGLPESARIDASQMLAERRPEIRRHMRALGNARLAAFRALTAEPFDQQAFGDAMAVVRDRTMTLQASVQAVLIDLSGSLDAETRGRLADAARDLHRHRRPGPP